MGFETKILADSVNKRGDRLTSLEVTTARYILPEFNTHRVFSRNSASSRAVPTEKKLLQVLENPFIPHEWGKNQPGMQSYAELSPENQTRAEYNWGILRIMKVLGTLALNGGLSSISDERIKQKLAEVIDDYPYVWELFNPLEGEALHKQKSNRQIETDLWHTIVVTSTEWDNFYALREHHAAQPEIRHTANAMHDAMNNSVPVLLKDSEWHVPFVTEQEKANIPFDKLVKIAVARCARVSYETHDSKKIDYEKDFALHDTLKSSGHMSPFEHVARPMTDDEYAESEWSGNFRGWHQYRKDIPNEDNYANVNV